MRAEQAGVGEEAVEAAPALEERPAQPVDAGAVLEVEGNERGRTAPGADGVVQLFQPADGARDGNHVGAGFGERQRRRPADAARCAGDDDDAIGEAAGHDTASAGLGEQAERADVVAVLAVGEPGRIGAGEAGVAELRLLRIALPPRRPRGRARRSTGTRGCRP